jgi:hypothetical protein
MPRPLRPLVLVLAGLLAWVAVAPARAAKLDREPNAWLDPLADPLERAGIDVLGSWGSIGAELPPARPRLAPLAPIAPDRTGQALDKWRFDYSEGTTAAVALIPHALAEGESLPVDAFRTAWDAAPRDKRLFVSFTRDDAGAARHLLSVLQDAGYAGYLVWDDEPAAAGELFARAGHHAVLDSPATRRDGGLWLQAWMLDTIQGEIGFRPVQTARDETPRVALGGGGGDGGAADAKGGAGGEGARSPSVLPEPPTATVDDLLRGRATYEGLPGGILFGQTAQGESGWNGARIVVGPDERLLMISPDGHRRARLPATSLADVRPCLEFALRTNPSQSVVDIDITRRIAMAPEFVDSAAGMRLVEADAQPFRHVRETGAPKSLLFDRSVRFRVDPDGDVRFHVVLDVWFVAPAHDGRARPVLTLQFETSERNPAALEPGPMEGRAFGVTEPSRQALARGVAPAARYAAWVGFFRWARASDVQLDELWSDLSARSFPPVRTPRFAPQT